ncbi:MAG: Asp-tRNA(Asn)/Glu-tRNA(Gln) amidotransferase subunit GatB, partial [Cyclonatronaceae bacterium]
MATDQGIPVNQDTEFETVIGLEVHAQLLTQSKAFAPVSIAFGNPPNTNITPLCIGHPGTLPVLNENLVRYAIRIGLATSCRIAEKSIFARKNYFYPDLPKGYQISQFETPICYDGHVDITLDDGTIKKIRIKRIHMEEDAGKSIHDQDPHNTLVDLNRAGTPLVEIVTEPDISTPREAYAYLTKIRQLVQYLDICDGNMEEGSLRCDANISIRPVGQKELGTRTELKNMNSFRNVERALTYEIERQKHVVKNGGTIVQQTLLWDPNKMETRQMRSKEEAHDYRYFPEPDLPPVFVTREFLEEVKKELPELPYDRRDRFVNEFKLPEPDASILTDDRNIADYFESALAHCGPGSAKSVANLILSEVRRVLNESG